jgi:phosphoserine aminotransferase
MFRSWSQKAFGEAKNYIPNVVEAQDNPTKQFMNIADPSEWRIPPESAYFYYCSNETIHGTEILDFPFHLMGDIPVVCDMSSDFLARPIDVSKYGLIFAGAQKNVGPSGSCVIIVRKDLIGKQMKITPSVTNYDTIVKSVNSIYNTPCTISNYVCGLNIKYMLKNGGLEYYDRLADERSKLVYGEMDLTPEYYINKINPKYRSRMNVMFRIKNGKRNGN